MRANLARPTDVFGPLLPITYARGMGLIRKGIFPPGVIVRLGRQIFVDTERMEEFIRSGGKALPGGWRLNANSGTAAVGAKDGAAGQGQ